MIWITLNLEIEALNLARDMDVDRAEAILRVDKVVVSSSMTSKELKETYYVC